MARPRAYRYGVRCPDCGSNWMSKHGFNQGMQRYRCGGCGRRYQPGGACHRPGPALKERALRMYTEGSSLRAIGRALGYSVQAVSNWVKGERIALSALRERNRRRTEGRAGQEPAPVVPFDEIWTYQRARWGAQRRDVWIWTAVVEADGSRCGWTLRWRERSEATLLRLYGRLPEAELYRSDACPVYQSWLPPGRHIVGKGGAVNRNEGLPLGAAQRAELADAAAQWEHQETGDAGVLAGPGLLAYWVKFNISVY